jgi:hypothetical protein
MSVCICKQMLALYLYTHTHICINTYIYIHTGADAEKVQLSARVHIHINIHLLIDKYIHTGADADKVQLSERVTDLIESTSLTVFQTAAEALFEKDKLTFAFELSTRVLLEEGRLDAGLYVALLGFERPKPQENPLKDWLPDVAWGAVLALQELEVPPDPGETPGVNSNNNMNSKNAVQNNNNNTTGGRGGKGVGNQVADRRLSVGAIHAGAGLNSEDGMDVGRRVGLSSNTVGQNVENLPWGKDRGGAEGLTDGVHPFDGLASDMVEASRRFKEWYVCACACMCV